LTFLLVVGRGMQVFGRSGVQLSGAVCGCSVGRVFCWSGLVGRAGIKKSERIAALAQKNKSLRVEDPLGDSLTAAWPLYHKSKNGWNSQISGWDWKPPGWG